MLIILTTHPIQYQVPLWQALARDGRVPFEVWYLCDHAVRATHDPEFGKAFAWDLGQGVLEGYPHRFLRINAQWSLHPSKFFGIRLKESLVPLLRERGATALWIQGWQKLAYWQAVVQARRAGVEVWLRGETNDLAPAGPPVKAWLKRLRLRWLFKRVDHFLCIGTANRRFYLKHGVSEEKLHSAPYCVDNARFATQAAALRDQRWEIRRAWGIPDDAFCVLFCGKFIQKKRPLDLVAAAELLEGKRENPLTTGLSPLASCPLPPIHLLFVGSGELGGALRGRCDVVFDAEAVGAVGGGAGVRNQGNREGEPASPPSKPRASFAGFLNQTEISRAYVAADCLVLPSDHGETWGLVVNEAMASGLPCIVSDAVGCGEDLVAETRPSFRFPLSDIKSLSNAIFSMAADLPRSSERELYATRINSYSFRSTTEIIGKLMIVTSH